MSLGERLKNGREERGLTIDEIAARTYIRASHLVALERNEFHLLPPSRIRYFVRDYARVLNLDPETFLAELPDDVESPPKAASPPPPAGSGKTDAGRARPDRRVKSMKPKRNLPPPTAVPDREDSSSAEAQSTESATSKSAARAAMVERIRRKTPRYSPIDQGNPMLARGLIGIALLLIVGVGIWYLFASGDDTGEEGVTLVSDTATDSPIRIIGEGDLRGPEDTAATEGLPAGDSLVLRGTFTQRVWYSISMDGEREDQGTLDSGEVREWRATESFSISLGNAGGVRFSINGKDIGTLGPRGGTVRGRMINAEGLQGGPTTTPSERRSRSTSQRRRTRSANADEAQSTVPDLQPSEPRDGLE